MTISICINCGETKKRPVQKCWNCGFRPQTDEDKAKSFVVSPYFEIDGEYKGKTKQELLDIGRSIKTKKYRFNDSEVNQIMEYASEVKSTTIPGLWIVLAKWLALPILLLLALIIILILPADP